MADARQGHGAVDVAPWQRTPLLAIKDREPRGSKRPRTLTFAPPVQPVRREKVLPKFLQQLRDKGPAIAFDSRGGDMVQRISEYLLQCTDNERATWYLHLAEYSNPLILTDVIARIKRERRYRHGENLFAIRASWPLSVAKNGVVHGHQVL